ncbi:hypothetical protein [Burkholderia territorii]|uniref:hypothetical protein n=1 Tax=Burkholderia territorii TaxID=1503055 RepID=UPI001452DD5D|nr:hypothetical protein [Burkholderia territorii]VWB39713.1 preprotein translocase subunit SecA [Burkholderia territorii]
MLSPHEFATLMLVREAPDQIDMNRTELDALLERQLVMLEHCTPGRRVAHLTHKGRWMLDALQRCSSARRGSTTFSANDAPNDGDVFCPPRGSATEIAAPESVA